jgi:hypothetical protein
MPEAPWSAGAVEARAVSSLLPCAGTARTHPPEQVAQIAASILAFGFTVPVLVDDAGLLVAGHGRVLAAKAIGLETVPAITLRHPTAARVRAFRLADNQIALNAGWDEVLLAAELQALRAEEFDLGLVGFDQAALDRLLALPHSGRRRLAPRPGPGHAAARVPKPPSAIPGGRRAARRWPLDAARGAGASCSTIQAATSSARLASPSRRHRNATPPLHSINSSTQTRRPAMGAAGTRARGRRWPPRGNEARPGAARVSAAAVTAVSASGACRLFK